MLDGLDAIDWGAVEHAYGPATDVPSLIRAIAGHDQEARAKALSELWGNIHHQGTVYEASAVAVPFVARLAGADLPADDRAQLIRLLAAIAGGWSYLEVHGRLIRDGLTDEDRDEMAVELRHVQAARQSVAAVASPLFAELAKDPPAVQWALAQLASQVPEASSTAAPMLRKLRSVTTNRKLRSAVELTLAMLLGSPPAETIRKAARELNPDRNSDLTQPSDLTEDRWSRLVAEYLFEDGAEEAAL